MPIGDDDALLACDHERWVDVREMTGEEPGRMAGAGPADPALPSLNEVDAPFLEGLRGIGPELAKSILEERRRRRGFRAWPEVLDVEGIGPAKLRVLQTATRLDEVRPAAPVDPAR